MADINNVIIVGRLTRDAELKYTNTGLAITKFSIANNQKKKYNEQWVDDVSYYDCALFGKLGESIIKYLEKGKQICVSGKLKQNRWEQDGQKRSKVEIIANDVQMFRSAENNNNQQQQSPPAQTPPVASQPKSSAPLDDEEIPF